MTIDEVEDRFEDAIERIREQERNARRLHRDILKIIPDAGEFGDCTDAYWWLRQGEYAFVWERDDVAIAAYYYLPWQVNFWVSDRSKRWSALGCTSQGEAMRNGKVIPHSEAIEILKNSRQRPGAEGCDTTGNKEQGT